MDEVRGHIIATLPNISIETVDSIIGKLGELGAESLADIKFLLPSDLETVLKPIQARKLLQSFKSRSQ
jgi:hypothetical protein